ncbi:N-acyl-D-amino-acid deacylase family protein [Fulvivirga sedimenti]|uniref:D-aminoacylase n=1 Tax=Fulvivirga sedimenti TaxID=2879465 RepID=A0A9X1HPX6_9BACT|nr:D-aminoacylase [Fulvivirga sedimenti]MCA6074976.1 D-aminoacylase [Fulvivirga sedimenti]MCA6076153.1 D-aminoacylase [Fulvivirga sedimenti]MCA6077281.1 D-aminoacylase [Fulvivirga sedimenti]
MKNILPLLLIIFSLFSCQQNTPEYDVIIRNGLVYDGSGQPPQKTDVGIRGDSISFIGDLSEATAVQEVDAGGHAVAPGFINMLSWAVTSLITDGKSQGDIRQGVTLEVFGEGISMGPVTETSAQYIKGMFDDDTKLEWKTLGEYLSYLEKKGISTNVASFVGATTLRVNTVGFEDREATPEELDQMKAMVRQAMEEGALGVGSSLIYAPAFYSTTEELIELSKVAAEYDGMYISHMRNEGNRLLESVDELIRIASEAGIAAEIYHLKMSGKDNWDKFDDVVRKVDSARAAGLTITADMYNYVAGSTGLDAAMPPWVQEGGYAEWVKRLQDPEIRKRVYDEMTTPTDKWENLMLSAGSAENVLLVGFRNDSLKYLQGKTLKEVAEMRGKSPEETAMDLVIQDSSRVETVYFLMSEENVKKQIALPWMTFGSDGASMATEGKFLENSTHPRSYGNFARLLGKYVREEKVIPLEEAIRKLTLQPAMNLGIEKRGALRTGYFADVVIFNPETITDHATFSDPHQYATGVDHVFVNGVQVIKNGEHTGALPGRKVTK